MYKKAIWILLVAVVAGLLWWKKILFHARVTIPTQQSSCLSMRKDTLDVAVLRALLPGKRWKYQYTLDKHSCFAKKKKEGRSVISEYVFELCAWDTLQLPPLDGFRKSFRKNFSGICYRWYADSAGIRIPVGYHSRNPYFVLFAFTLKRAPESSLMIYGKDAKGDLFITKLSADTLVINYGEILKNKQGEDDWGFEDLFVATK
ncbi:hypothetical protein SAMN04488109_1263 [Chryseolinea serpens]|uniref:Uncharacterized protein n=1 Tax=Chryseolinea serpens TaxID=947013 RepID=A0A1M5LK98_9BACT|nr:hypothetical protein [Chryseolinea serpens]SHG65458.1 hypothetical protein SAMN04488109_1263 [Chryseolinea serpens]